MSAQVKKIMWITLYRYKELETKLEKMAAKGLLLEKCGTYLWTFRKAEPKQIKYTITYFAEGSVFQPGPTDNQQTYYEYAQAAGWTFIAQYNQMQIFCSERDNPVPFETDEQEKFNNIKRCMNKTFLPSMILMLMVFLMNACIQVHTLQTNPIHYLSNPMLLLSGAMIFTALIYFSYSLINYIVWCIRSSRSIATGGICSESTGMVHRIIDIIFLSYTLGSLGWFLLYLAAEGGWLRSLLIMMQVPIIMMVFWSSIQYWKKKQVSAKVNRILSFTTLIVADLAYLALILFLLFKFNFTTDATPDYRTITWQMTPTTSQDYRLYEDDIPLTCEDLYGKTDYTYYSYEKEMARTIFLTKSSYMQNSLPAKDAPPEIQYEILEPQWTFVYSLAKQQLLEIPHWRENQRFQTIDNAIFGTTEAYQAYYNDTATGTYLLFFTDKLIQLELSEPATTAQISIIKEKLQIP